MALAILLGTECAVPNQSPGLEELFRRQAEWRFHQKLAEFIRAFNDFLAEYAGRGTYNIRKARRVREAWRALEREHPWPQ